MTEDRIITFIWNHSTDVAECKNYSNYLDYRCISTFVNQKVKMKHFFVALTFIKVRSSHTFLGPPIGWSMVDTIVVLDE